MGGWMEMRWRQGPWVLAPFCPSVWEAAEAPCSPAGLLGLLSPLPAVKQHLQV